MIHVYRTLSVLLLVPAVLLLGVAWVLKWPGEAVAFCGRGFGFLALLIDCKAGHLWFEQNPLPVPQPPPVPACPPGKG